MAGLINLSINLDTLDKTKVIVGKKGKYYPVTLSLNDETKFGNNVTMFDSQTKEQRDAKEAKNYLGNGKVIWTDGNIALAEKEEQGQAPAKAVQAASADDLPF